MVYRLKPERTELLPHIGSPVCLVMKDGSLKFGQLTACRLSSLQLNGPTEQARSSAVSRNPCKSGKSGKRTTKTQSSAAKSGPHSPESAPLADEIHPEWQEPPFHPLALEPLFPPVSAPDKPENVPLDDIDSIFLL
jgi:hypothetical protein